MELDQIKEKMSAGEAKRRTDRKGNICCATHHVCLCGVLDECVESC